MIRLHYYGDRQDSKFWQEMSHMPVNSELQEMIDLWAERPPSRYDFANNHGEMFGAPHLTHVGQGQGIISVDACTRAIEALHLREAVDKQLSDYRHYRHDHVLVDHAQALREIELVDEEWN
jgi:hypothetical protein